jgi:hypothetical protein
MTMCSGLALVGCSGSSSSLPAPSPSPTSAAERAAQIRAAELAARQRVEAFPVGAAAAKTGQKPAVPAAGAYFGAWVQPSSYTQPGRAAAVYTLESQLGRRLDIVHTYRRESEEFPRASDFAAARQGSYLLLSWAIDDAARIAAGREDGFIRQRAHEIRSFGYPIFLEFQWEMNRPNLAGVVHGPSTYVAAWRRVHRIFAAMHVDNVSWVWCPTASGFADDQAPAYYPGNHEVDWICTDAYPGSRATPLATLIAPFLTWAAQNGKPAMIGEFGITHAVDDSERAQWLQQAQSTVSDHPQVEAVVYFDSGLHATDPGGDYIPTDASEVLQAFRAWADSPTFDPQRLTAGP